MSRESRVDVLAVLVTPKGVVVLLLISLLLGLAPTLHAQSRTYRDLKIDRDSRRLALVIGNNRYSAGPLQNAVNDARAMEKALRDAKFEVTVETDVDKRRLESAVDTFAKKLGKGDIALFYYAGHGIQIDGENYLIPVDFAARDEVDAKYDSYSAARAIDKMELSGAALKIVILDACRNNPFRVSRSLGGGLAQMNTGVGTYIAFATSPNRVASEFGEPGGNGVFTKYLVENLKRPGLTLDSVFSKVRQEVFQASNGSQQPWISSSVIGEFYFREPLPTIKPSEPDPPAPVKPQIDAAELTYWRSIEKDASPSSYATYLSRYPAGNFVEIARLRLREATPKIPEISDADGKPRVAMNSKDRQEYIWVPPGSFRMGCESADKDCEEDEKPVRDVGITQGFWLGRTEVTVGAYKRYTVATSAPMPQPTRMNPKWIHTDHPITRVSWNDAKAFCAWLGGRLPSESEWEYATRAGSNGQRYPWGSSITREDANFLGVGGNDLFEETAPVRNFNANRWGLYDMSGNVWEWVNDFYDPKYYSSGPQKDPQGPENGKERVLRGGSWFSAEKHLRSSMRRHSEPHANANHYGFRCALPAVTE